MMCRPLYLKQGTNRRNKISYDSSDKRNLIDNHVALFFLHILVHGGVRVREIATEK